jgi:hypothetical protein
MIVARPCPICSNKEAPSVRIGAENMHQIRCPRCGDFDFNLELPAMLQGYWLDNRERFGRGLADGTITHRVFASRSDVAMAIGELDGSTGSKLAPTGE